jgi:hypothetical protein
VLGAEWLFQRHLLVFVYLWDAWFWFLRDGMVDGRDLDDRVCGIGMHVPSQVWKRE